jgi:ribonuclease HI
MKSIDIYTDSSSTHNYGIGILIVGYDGLKTTFEKSYHFSTNGDILRSEYNLPKNRSKTADGELYAIYKALEILENPNEIKVNLYTDSLLSANKIYEISRSRTPFEKLMVPMIKDLIKSKNVEVMWVKAHCGNWGNEIVDELTKKAKYGDKYIPNYKYPKL